MTSRWLKHWDTVDTTVDPRVQVGKTVGGKPVDVSQLDILVRHIAQTLELKKTDILCDLCCGNGLVTRLLAPLVAHVHGVDVSVPLVRVARQNATKNASYTCARVPEGIPGTFPKFLMVEGLQYFTAQDGGYVTGGQDARSHHPPLLIDLLKSVKENITPGGVFLICGIPDKDRLFDFYDTAERRREYEHRLEQGCEAMGTWWYQSDLIHAARVAGLEPCVISQPPGYYTAHYRFDLVLHNPQTPEHPG